MYIHINKQNNILSKKTNLEEIEDIELLRALEIGLKIKTLKMKGDSFSVDIIEDLKNDGSDDPEMEMTPGRFADHIGDKGEEFLKEYEAILKKLSE